MKVVDLDQTLNDLSAKGWQIESITSFGRSYWRADGGPPSTMLVTCSADAEHVPEGLAPAGPHADGSW